MPTSKTFTIDSHTITLRQPTEAQAITYFDKKADASSPLHVPADATDDGDEEILDCVTTPDRDTMIEMLEVYPLLTLRLGVAFKELAGNDVAILKDDSLVTDELRKAHGKLLLGLRVGGTRQKDAAGNAVVSGGTPVVCKKISRIEMKFLQQATGAQKRNVPTFAAFAREARSHVVSPSGAELDRLALEVPCAVMNVGAILFYSALGNLKEETGK